jgi:hypothetical protein
MRSLGLCSLALTCWLVGCVQQIQALWMKPGAETDEFQQARYGCMQGSQQPNSSAYIGRYGGVANSGMVTNDGLFTACMNAGGWVLMPVTDVKAFNESVRPIGETRIAICGKPDMQVLWKKTPCKSNEEPAPAQLSDRSKISPPEKEALLRWNDLVTDSNEKLAGIYRQYNTKNGDAVASTMENLSVEFKQLVSDFSSGGMTWGEFNRRRSDTNRRMRESLKMALNS